jgi:hypothetical protein
MVLRWYGCDIDPAIAQANALDGNNPDGRGGGVGVFGTLAAACGMCAQERNAQSDWNSWLLATHEPMVVGTTQFNGHYVAMAGFDGQNYYVNDPGVNGGLTTISASAFPYKTQALNFYRPIDGACH